MFLFLLLAVAGLEISPPYSMPDVEAESEAAPANGKGRLRKHSDEIYNVHSYASAASSLASSAVLPSAIAAS